MTSKFKVGDKVEVVGNKHGGWAVGTVGKITDITKGFPPINVEKDGDVWYHTEDELELFSPKLTKNQRIAKLEEEVAELKLIVHQLRKPSTVVQEVIDKTEWQRGEIEGVIEFEGAQYRKVEREAREGDVVIFGVNETKEFHSVVNKPYLVVSDDDVPRFTGESGTNYRVYTDDHNRTPETVDVYERIEPSTSDVDGEILMKRGNDDWQSISKEEFAEIICEKPPNQLRAEIIEKAKVFIDENGGDDYSFEIDEDKRTVFVWKIVRKGEGYDAQCHLAECPKDKVFNKHIQSAIAFGKAENIDVSEFEQAVQPTVAVGQVVKTKSGNDIVKITQIKKNSISDEAIYFGHLWAERNDFTIINDTNAIYGEVK